jgi:hypothetical protein
VGFSQAIGFRSFWDARRAKAVYTAKSGITKNQWVRISMRNRRRTKTGGFAGFPRARVREVQKTSGPLSRG